jgi:hypothetical protein
VAVAVESFRVCHSAEEVDVTCQTELSEHRVEHADVPCVISRAGGKHEGCVDPFVPQTGKKLDGDLEVFVRPRVAHIQKPHSSARLRRMWSEGEPRGVHPMRDHV